MRQRHCPRCGADLYGDVVPGQYDPDGKEQRYHRGIGVEIWGIYDGILFYACPDCHGTWHRWTAQYNPQLWAAAEKYRARFTADMRSQPPCSA